MAQFRAKARAVELLGKGQIADLPTAISELWKNGYDAYGDKLEAFLYQNGYKGSDQPYFVISDDGKGMTRDDILNKWFVLGTDSKSRDNILDKKGDETLNKPPRIKMGEKGIGRLAVAYLGPQMLMLSKKKDNPLQVVFFDWRILECYESFLSDVNIPLRGVSSVHAFKKAWQEIKDEFIDNFTVQKGRSDPWSEQSELKKTIVSDCQSLLIPDFLFEEEIRELIEDQTKSHATKFLIFKPENQILDLVSFIKSDSLKEGKDDITTYYTISTLAGLFNLFKTENPIHKTRFWVKSNSGFHDLLTLRSFFNPQDFEDCDHLIEGEFDDSGEFAGQVRIYNKKVKHKFFPVREKKNTKYGRFRIKLGYVQDQEGKSLVKEERKRAFEQKLQLYSGLFIYRDGFRVLPYGRSDSDFLEFEERRTFSAGQNFFSKRRMFGYIEISRIENKGLKDKSSREGFINNEAYREFKTDLIGFFKDLAKKYFATESEFDYKQDQQEDLQKIANSEKSKDQEIRKDFVKKLKNYPEELEALAVEYGSLISNLQDKITNSNFALENIQSVLVDIHENKIRYQNLNLKKPVRVKTTDLQNKNLHNYKKQYATVGLAISNSTAVVNQALGKLKIQQLFKEFESRNKLFKNTLVDLFAGYEDKLNVVNKKLHGQLSDEKVRFLEEFDTHYKTIIPANNNPDDIVQSLNLIESIFIDTREKVVNRITPYLTHLEGISMDIDEDSLVGFYKNKFEEIKEEWNKTYELAQLGIAVEIIDHQFNTLYAQLAQNIKELQKSINPNKKAEDGYSRLVNAFHHLEDNYKLLQPLYRTTGRIRRDVSGLEIYDYTKEFFQTKLELNGIEFQITDEGSRWKELTYESILKPVVINIINNAIFWLQPVKKKVIKIDSIDGKFLLMNSGVRIDDFSIDKIFALFYTERPKGRGIGLYLAQKSLEGIGFKISATNDNKYNLLNGACFVIEKVTS